MSLLEMSQFGGSDAEAIKSGIDYVFLQEMKLSDDAYSTCLIGATADGASVNMGKYSGILTRFKKERPWLITIHCVNHRMELAAKDSMNQSIMIDAQQFYLTNYFLLKNSGAIKAEVRKSAEVLGITSYELPKILVQSRPKCTNLQKCLVLLPMSFQKFWCNQGRSVQIRRSAWYYFLRASKNSGHTIHRPQAKRISKIFAHDASIGHHV